MCSTEKSEATAPDWAMRVAEQLTQSGYLRTADIAALIREAGSERERGLENGLRQLIDHSRRYKNGWMGAGVLEEHLIEASRLLGGESNATTK